MRFDLSSQNTKILQEQKKHRQWMIAFLCLSVTVVLGTAAALKLYGQALTHKVKVLDCRAEVHEHTDECYVYDEEAGEDVPVCGYADYLVHVHNDDCRDENGRLVCPLEEIKPHKHTDACFEEQQVLICGMEGIEPAEDAAAGTAGGQAGQIPGSEGQPVKTTEAPTSDASAKTESKLVCAEEEHTHTDDCYGEAVLTCGLEKHKHGDGCYEMTLTCEMPEHAHESSCYDEDGELTCGFEEHEHGDSCYEKTLTCKTEEHEHGDACYGVRQLTCKKKEHEHTDSCYAQAAVKTAASEIKAAETKAPEGGVKGSTGHVHTDQCYETRKVVICGELELHTHDADSESNTCCYTPDCFGKDGKLIEGSRPSCGLLQLEQHEHTKECFKTVELTPEEVAALNNGAKLHIHDDSCYDEDGELICGHNATHIHGPECYDEEGKLICGYGEQRALTEEEQKEVEKVNRLIAELPSEEEITRKMAEYEETGEEGEEAFSEYTAALLVQIQEAYGAYLELDEELREYVTGADYLLSLWEMMGTGGLDENPKAVPDYAAFLPIGAQPEGKKNGMVLELLYGDTKSHADKGEEGEEPNYTRDVMKGNFKLYTSNILGTTDIGDITLSLYFPKEYMDPKGISILEFPEDQVQHEISQVTEETRDGKDYYKISITLKDYKPTGALTLPFNMKFKTAEVPVDYELKIFGVLETGKGEDKKESNPTAENIYHPKYEKPKITKYVNTNVYENMKNDHTRVSAKVNNQGILEDSQYVSFWYKLGDNHALFRAYDTITLRDTLPTYEDGEGKTQYAVFDSAANPGWSLDPADTSGHTVMRVFKVTELQGAETWKPEEYDNKLMKQIEQAELKLRFPGCKIDEENADGFLTKDLTNHIGAVCEPYQTPAEDSELHEENDTCGDNIIFTLTSQPGAEGSFTKGNSSDTIIDTHTTRSGAYRWSLAFENKSSSNLVNVEVGDDVIDERLKFQSIVVEKTLLENIESVEAFTYDSEGGAGEASPGETSGETTPTEPEKEKGDIYDVKEFASTGTLSLNSFLKHNTYTLTLSPEKEYRKFVIHFKDNYEVAPGGKIEVWPFSTFRNPDVKHFVAGAENDLKNVYKNHAYTAYQEKGYTGPYNTTYFLKSENKFKLIENKESIWVEQNLLNCNDMNYPQKDENGNLKYAYDSPNKSYGFAQLYIKGSLAEGKDYDDLCLIDLLPESLELYPDSEGKISLGDGYAAKFIERYELIENYHNSGRTALIMHLNAEEVRKDLDASDGNGSKSIYIAPRVRVKPDAVPGAFTNDVYLVSDDFDAPPTGKGQQADSLNIQGDGVDVQIRWEQKGGDIQAAAGIYARKYIAKADSNAWSTNKLNLKVGDDFQYKLSMMNHDGSVHTNLVVYDALPRIGDKSVNGQADRGSEFTVNLRGPIIPPDGYQVYYTSSEEVYKKDMASLVDTAIWTQDVNGWTQEQWNTITAFKFVANEGVGFDNKQLDFVIPVKVMDALTEESKEMLEDKEAQDRESGTAVYLEATNSFGYSTNNYQGQNVESNYVKAQISFAGFVVKKTDENGKALSGATFKLEKQKPSSVMSTGGTGSEGGSTPDGDTNAQNQDGVTSEGTGQNQGWETVVSEIVSDENGKVSFKNLTVGTYRLTETKAPDGYKISTEPVTVTITFDDTTMEYTVAAAGLTGSGTGKNPFVVINETFYMLPETGGPGTIAYAMAGVLCLMLGTGFLYRKKCGGRRG